MQYLKSPKQIKIKKHNPTKEIIFGAMFSIFFWSAIIGGCQIANAQVSDDRAVNAIIGEAENQGYDGMKAVACGIRNRGTLQGVYGEHAKRVVNHQYSDGIEAQAIVAWQTSANPEECLFLHGADHWENIKAFGKPGWADSMTETYRYKDHVFYHRK